MNKTSLKSKAVKTKSLDLANTYVTTVKRLDGLGQGVCFVDDNPVFVPKTLPGEKIRISLHQKKKGVYFGTAVEILEASEQRINPECTHYSQCRGCDYLHCSYSAEIEFKENSLRQQLNSFGQKYDLNILPASSRLAYRNRLQLHYNQQALGFQGLSTIVPVPNCLLPTQELAKALKSLYLTWPKNLPANQPKQGHVEIYQQDDLSCSVSWNKSYAHLGFQQVNAAANLSLCDLIARIILPSLSTEDSILELFCGSGNLLRNYQGKARILGFDHAGKLAQPHKFIQADLYDESAINQVFKECSEHSTPLILLDPPRTGWKQLSVLTNQIRPSQLIYVSCWPATLVRDLSAVWSQTPWKSMEVYLLDMFPGTKHFETIVNIQW